MVSFAMGNQLDTLIKLNAEGLETEDNLRYVIDALVGHMSTQGGHKFWRAMSDINLYGDDVLDAVNERLDKMEVPNDDFTNSAPRLKSDKG
tara:strand:- start:435 stop:707 length:273 start_codon:yes stop_codon:yes gene_type:complete